jgi:hypothetical protein
MRNALLQLLQFVNYLVAPGAHALDFGLHLLGLHEIVRHIHTAGRHQHGAANGHTA